MEFNLVKPLIKRARSFPVTIFIAGKYSTAEKILKKYCDEVGYCVTLHSVEYIYKGGTEHGISVGLINYPRFPNEPTVIIDKAKEIAEELRIGMKQESYSIQTPHDTIWYSYRKDDVLDQD